MMKTLNLSVHIALICCLISFSSLAIGSTLVYERTYSELPVGSNTVRITLSDTGQLVIERPELMTHSGRHEFKVSPESYLQLQQQLQALPFDTLDMQAYLNQRGDSLSFVSHPEYSRFISLDAARTVQDAVEIRSLNAYSQRFQDDAYLSQALELEQNWWSLMDNLLQGEAQ